MKMALSGLYCFRTLSPCCYQGSVWLWHCSHQPWPTVLLGSLISTVLVAWNQDVLWPFSQNGPLVDFWPHTACLCQQSHHAELFLLSSTICRGSSGIFLLGFTSAIVSSKLSGTLSLGPCQGVKPHINKLPFVLLIVCPSLTQYP